MAGLFRSLIAYFIAVVTCRIHVLKLENNMNNIITFQTEVNGKRVVGPSWLKNMKAKKIKVVDKTKILRFCGKQKAGFRIRLLLDGKPTKNCLELHDLFHSTQITFENKEMDKSSQVLDGLKTAELRIFIVEDIGEIPLETQRSTRTNLHGGAASELQNDLNDDAAEFRPTMQQFGDAESVLPNNQATAAFVALNYHKPSTICDMKVARISTSDLQQEIEIWKHAIVGYYVGDVKGFVGKQWEEFGSFKTYELQQKGFFLFDFSDGADKDKLLQKGQWFINGRPFILKSWEPNLTLDSLRFLAKVPLWVKFPNLDIKFRSKTSLDKISSLIGKPLFADQATSQNESLEYARVCIEVKLGAKLPEKVLICMDGDHHDIEQFVEYEWKPQPCSFCCSLAHESSACALSKGNESPISIT